MLGSGIIITCKCSVLIMLCDSIIHKSIDVPNKNVQYGA